MRNQQNVKVKVNSTFETICPFPVGYVYMSSNNTSPANIYGGTWSAISGGRYMRAAAAWGNGGSNTITIKQMPAHQHNSTGTWLAESVVGGGAATGFDTYWGTGNLTYNTAPVQGGATVLPYVPKRLGVVQNCLKRVMLRA